MQTDPSAINSKLCAAHVNLYEEPVGGYPDSLKKPLSITGKSFLGLFKPLMRSEYFIDSVSGLIGLRINLPESYHIAISYKTNSGKKFGVRQFEAPGFNDTLVLKLIKGPTNPNTTPELWELKVKSIYQFETPFPDNNTKFDFKICFVEDNNECNEFISINVTFVKAFRLDRFGNQINRFDPVENVTIIRDMNVIILPYLEPFNQRIAQVTSEQRYLFPELYNSPKTVVQYSPTAIRYRLNAVYSE